jgi:S-adenosylmethionine decarboxylase
MKRRRVVAAQNFLEGFHNDSMMNVGAEWMIDACGCSPELLCDLQALKKVCAQIINDLDLRVVGQPMWHQFGPPGGVTGLFLLTESHLACHTYPENGLATFNLYCCNTRPEWQWQGHLRKMLGASTVVVRFVRRGTALGEGVKG